MRWQYCALFAAILGTGGCATRKLPEYERPLARTPIQRVRTTAYTHTESDHLQYGKRNAEGGMLRSGDVKSAAADWSRWPAGTLFRIVETGEWYRVDDYGWALAGRNTIDLYKPSRATMNAWGAKPVTIEVVRWGDPRRSRTILEPRSKHAHVKRMLKDLRRQT
jgi:3D (Asp-Asp-Asp) domain-containing protein